MKKMNRSVRSLCLAAMIAALYLALTLLFQPISFGAVQFRISEAMTLLPAIFPEATIGLTLGCFLSNFLAGANVYDVVFGTLATLLAALISWRVGKKKLWYAAIPPVVCNGVIVGLVLTYAYQIPALWMNMLTVAAGEAVVCFALEAAFLPELLTAAATESADPETVAAAALAAAASSCACRMRSAWRCPRSCAALSSLERL